jgi:hypothetical protein
MNRLAYRHGEVAEMLGVSPKMVTKLRQAGHIHGRKLGTGQTSPWLYSAKSVEAFIESNDQADLHPALRIA